MYLDYVSLFWVIIAVLTAGILLGRIWSFLTSRDERMTRGKLVRGSSSYLLGMNYLISNQSDLAIMELSQAAKEDPDAIEVAIVLGNLYREKGQSERAIQIHREVTQRKVISPSEYNLARFCLGLDYKSAGFVDRAVEIFEQILENDRTDENVFAILIKLNEELGQLDKAYRLRQELIRLQRSDDYSHLAFLEVEMGRKRLQLGETEAAERRFRRAIDLDEKAYPAYIFYGDLLLQLDKVDEAVEMWETMIRNNAKRAHLVFPRLQKAYNRLGDENRLVELLTDLIADHPYDWRSRLFLAKVLADTEEIARSFELLKEAARQNPHNLAIHQQLWQLFASDKLDSSYIREYLSLIEEAIFFLDPFVCIECGYRTTEFLWKCPHCHSWESFVEVRM